MRIQKRARKSHARSAVMKRVSLIVKTSYGLHVLSVLPAIPTMSKNKTDRLVWHALALKDAYKAYEDNPSEKTNTVYMEAWGEFLDSVEIYENGELDLSDREITFTHG